ncbi:MAG: Ig-like domain-containing protein, partial [Lachnospiraceae bacterium]|nr:Ig-like domain-containing protein [Lachnospiraceae bacterium]
MKYNIKYRWQKRLLVLALAGFLSAQKGAGIPSFSAGEWIVADAAQNSLSKTELTISKGERSALTVKGSYKKVAWSVDDKKVATVTENGVVEGVS